jgi:hypothetical protein
MGRQTEAVEMLATVLAEQLGSKHGTMANVSVTELATNWVAEPKPVVEPAAFAKAASRGTAICRGSVPNPGAGAT